MAPDPGVSMRVTQAVATDPPVLSPAVRTRASPLAAVRRLVRNTSRGASWLWLAVLVFVGVSAWWLTQDTRMPDYDSGFHMYTAFIYHQAIASGNVALPFTSYDSYPPLVHVLGALTIFIAGMHPMALILSSNLVFVPLLAFGCYGVGKIVAGERAGLLAGVFALGTPMFVSMMHLYDLDPPQAAIVAVSVWAVLSSRRFKSLHLSLVSGIVCGLALMTKQTSVIFLGGLLLAVVVRGGWRNRGGLLVFSLALFDVAGIWYALHFSQLTETFRSIGGWAGNSIQAPPVWSLRNASWYFWDLVNEQTLTPFAVVFIVGCVIAITRVLRSHAARQSYLPELLIGALVSYLGMTYLTHKDPRYTLPALVYVAVLATFWIPAVARPWLRRGLIATVGALAAINFVGMSFGIGGVSARAMVPLPGAQNSIIYPGNLTLYEDTGWVRGGPEHNGDPLRLMQQLRATGVRAIAIDPSATQVDFSTAGLLPLAETEGIAVVSLDSYRSGDRYLLLRRVGAGDPPPCQWIRGSDSVVEQQSGTRLGVYVLEGSVAGLNSALLRNPADPQQRYAIACPDRPAVMFPRS